jgi:hypothetical protein
MNGRVIGRWGYYPSGGLGLLLIILIILIIVALVGKR